MFLFPRQILMQGGIFRQLICGILSAPAYLVMLEEIQPALIVGLQRPMLRHMEIAVIIQNSADILDNIVLLYLGEMRVCISLTNTSSPPSGQSYMGER